jgi:succinate dehydrogenase / fumarate reductase cytochrome b subunit
MTSDNRPLSPHLQIYRPQLTSVLSITHRATGLFLAIGAVVLVYWLVSIASGAHHYSAVHASLSSWVGKLLLLAWTFSLFYHLCNGVRHLCWDVGLGYELRSAYLSGYAVIAVSVLLTAITWISAWTRGGGL